MLTKLHKGQKGQTALETAIILIAFIVVASVFAFTILSAGSASTEKGEEAIYAGLEGVQSSMSIKGAVVGTGASNLMDTVVFTLALVSGGDPVDLTAGGPLVISYRDQNDMENTIPWTASWIVDVDGGTPDNMLEEGELVEITVTLTGNVTNDVPGPNDEFTLEVKPQTGAVLVINRTAPAAIEAVMELR